MKRLLLALVLALSCFSALAQGLLPRCVPSVFGGSGIGVYDGYHGDPAANHRWGGTFCPDFYGFRYTPYVVAKRGDHQLVNVPTIKGESTFDYVMRYWSANVNMTCGDTAITSICDTGKAEMAKLESPEPPAFVVAKNGTNLTAPVYSKVDEDLGPLISGKRVAVGTTCACWAGGIRKGKTKTGTPYCPWFDEMQNTRSDELARCAPKK